MYRSIYASLRVAAALALVVSLVACDASGGEAPVTADAGSGTITGPTQLGYYCVGLYDSSVPASGWSLSAGGVVTNSASTWARVESNGVNTSGTLSTTQGSLTITRKATHCLRIQGPTFTGVGCTPTYTVTQPWLDTWPDPNFSVDWVYVDGSGAFPVADWDNSVMLYTDGPGNPTLRIGTSVGEVTLPIVIDGNTSSCPA